MHQERRQLSTGDPWPVCSSDVIISDCCDVAHITAASNTGHVLTANDNNTSHNGIQYVNSRSIRYSLSHDKDGCISPKSVDDSFVFTNTVPVKYHDFGLAPKFSGPSLLHKRSARSISLGQSPSININDDKTRRHGRSSALSITIPPWDALSFLKTTAPKTSIDMSMEANSQGLENAYPDGPVLVCEPNIYLYSEPDAETAAQFDVVINVAREVKPPFGITETTAYGADTMDGDRFSESSAGSGSDSLMFSPVLSDEVSSPGSCVSVCSSLNGQSHSDDKPAHLEYIYAPWDHNSNLAPDLKRLTDIMASRSLQKKKILVHCQCGISRSASLVVAYVMRQEKCDVNTAYNIIKGRSPNISPNMTLMFQLMDWASELRHDD